MTQEIDRSDWSSFFGAFSRQHEGTLTNLEVTSPKAEDTELKRLPLVEISADMVDRVDAIWIMFGVDHDIAFAQTINGPRRVLVERTGDGADRAVQFESSDGTRTLLLLGSTPVK